VVHCRNDRGVYSPRFSLQFYLDFSLYIRGIVSESTRELTLKKAVDTEKGDKGNYRKSSKLQ
jgi:hypothetical protein